MSFKVLVLLLRLLVLVEEIGVFVVEEGGEVEEEERTGRKKIANNGI